MIKKWAQGPSKVTGIITYCTKLWKNLIKLHGNIQVNLDLEVNWSTLNHTTEII